MKLINIHKKAALSHFFNEFSHNLLKLNNLYTVIRVYKWVLLGLTIFSPTAGLVS